MPPTPEAYIPFHPTAKDPEDGLPPIGLLRPEVLDCLKINMKSEPTPFKITSSPSGAMNGICFNDWVVEQGKMGEVINDIAVKWRDEGKFPGPLGGESLLVG